MGDSEVRLKPDNDHRSVRLRRTVEHLGETEVEDLDRAVGPNLDVGRLQIAMNDALLVRRFEGVGNLSCDAQRFGNRQAADELGDGRAVNQFHHQRADDVPGTRRRDTLESVDGGDVGMIQRRERPGLAFEPGQALAVVRERLGQHLDRDVSRKVGVPRQVHLTHATRAERGLDVVRAQSRARGQPHRITPPRTRRREPGPFAALAAAASRSASASTIRAARNGSNAARSGSTSG